MVENEARELQLTTAERFAMMIFIICTRNCLFKWSGRDAFILHN